MGAKKNTCDSSIVTSGCSHLVTLGGVAFTENDGHDPWTGKIHAHPGVEL